MAKISFRTPGPYDLFIVGVAILAMVLVSWQFCLSQGSPLADLFSIFDYVFCLIFFVDYIHQITVSRNKIKYIFTWGVFDLASAIPTVGPLRVLRFAKIFRVLYIIRTIRLLGTVLRRDLVASTVTGVLLLSTVIVVGCCIGVLHFETDAPNANIHSAEDVAWWAVVTISTVGYGELFPVTPGGRILAVFIMVVGIGSFATLVGAVAGVMLRGSGRKMQFSKLMLADGKPTEVQSSLSDLLEKNRLLIERLERLESELKQGEDPKC